MSNSAVQKDLTSTGILWDSTKVNIAPSTKKARPASPTYLAEQGESYLPDNKIPDDEDDSSKRFKVLVFKFMKHHRFTEAEEFLKKIFQEFNLQIPIKKYLEDTQLLHNNSTFIRKYLFADGKTASVRISGLEGLTSSGCYMDSCGNNFQFVRIDDRWSVNYSNIVHQVVQNH